MLSELRHGLGIREIAGDIVIDRTCSAPPGPTSACRPSTRSPSSLHVIPDALNLAGSLVPVEISSQDPARPGDVTARAVPTLPGLVIDARAMRLTELACKDWDQGW